eukprot:gene3493-6953_t
MTAFVFGMVTEMNAGVGTVGFVAVIMFLIVFDYITNLLKMLEEDYHAVYEMIQAVYKELMIMGFMSFAIMMLESSTKEVHNVWMEAIDFAHIILFFVAIFFVIHATFLIFLSVSLAKGYRRSHVHDEADIIAKVAELQNKNSYIEKFLYDNSFLPLSNLRHNVEFKVLYHLFRDTFDLPIAFDFAHYLTLCTEKYALSILEISSFQRCLLAMVVCINLIRIELLRGTDTQTAACIQHTDSGSSSSVEEHTSTTCSEEMIFTFCLTGYSMIAWSVFLVYLARYYETRLIKHSGAKTVAMYQQYLAEKRKRDKIILKRNSMQASSQSRHGERDRDRDTDHSSRANSHHQLMDIEDGMKRKELTMLELKQNIEKLKIEKLEERKHATRAVFGMYFAIEESIYYYTCLPVIQFFKKPNKPEGIVHPNNASATTTSAQPLHTTTTTIMEYMSSTKRLSAVPENMRESCRKASAAVKYLNETDSSKASISNKVHPINSTERLIDSKEDEMNTASPDNAEHEHEHDNEEDVDGDDNGVVTENFMVTRKTKAETFADIYFLGNENIFMRTVELTIMLNCMWLSLWATNYITLANQSSNAVLWMMPVLGLVVKTSAKLVAITKFDLEVFSKVLETAEETTLLVKELRHKIITQTAQLVGGRSQKELIDELFREIDIDGSGSISKIEFRRFLRVLDLNFSKNKFNHLFQAIDQDKDGLISILEYKNMVFGETEFTQEEAIRQLQEAGRKEVDKEVEDMEVEAANRKDRIARFRSGSLMRSMDGGNGNGNGMEDGIGGKDRRRSWSKKSMISGSFNIANATDSGNSATGNGNGGYGSSGKNGNDVSPFSPLRKDFMSRRSKRFVNPNDNNV